MNIRRFRNSDAKKTSRMICENLTLVNSKEYPAKIIKLLAKGNSPEKLIKKQGERLILVAIDRKNILGTAALDKCRIRGVYVSVKHHKKGIGSALIDKVEFIARKKKAKRLFLYSGLGAVGFYEKKGYKAIKKEKKSLEGLPFEIVLMKKKLE